MSFFKADACNHGQSVKLYIEINKINHEKNKFKGLFSFKALQLFLQCFCDREMKEKLKKSLANIKNNSNLFAVNNLEHSLKLN